MPPSYDQLRNSNTLGAQQTAPVRDSDVNTSIKELTAVIEQLAARLETLDGRLMPVLSPPSPATPPMNNAEKLSMPRAPLAEIIQRQSNRLTELLSSVETIHSRLQL
jgi:methyl-accepting chemotaxis protein